jgi:hydroxymethylpyrimidine pyrophosphatase-like HAD family hydrolase
MYFLALATDYDGTLATDGIVDRDTLEALRRFRETGRKTVMVTGRELPDLIRTFPEIDVFDRIVAENGALLYAPATREETMVAPAASEALVARLRRENVPVSVGRSIVATWQPHETAVLEAIRDLGLELQIIFNKGAVMVLPSGVNKASGLAAALADLALSPHNVVGVGDAENDHAFLGICGLAVAVQNALPMLKGEADIVTAGARGAGVRELMERIVAEDGELAPVARHGILLGRDRDGADVHLRANRAGLLLAGTSGIGKSTLATALTEGMADKRFQFCVFDPEGDYRELDNAVVLGDAQSGPRHQEVLDLLRNPDVNVVVNMLAVKMDERPGMFAKLLPELAEMRVASGRPHWLLIDEAHHLLPGPSHAVASTLPRELPAAILITVHPDMVSPDALASLGAAVALGDAAPSVLATFAGALGEEPPPPAPRPGKDEVLYWERGGGPPVPVLVAGPRQAHRRHTRKYAEGDLGPDKSFFFRGPENRLNLRVQNLRLFVQVAEGVDDATWEHHLRSGDYSAWFRTSIKDDALADEAAAVEEDRSLDAAESRRRIADAIAKRYTAPARAE